MPHLSLKLFGPLSIAFDDQSVDVGARKAQALVAYLVVNGQAHSRDTLATLLWPEANQTRARANLRRTLWTLNTTPVGAWLDSSDEIVCLGRDNLTVDTAQFERLLLQGNADVDSLAGAVSLFRGDFLADFYLADSSEFEEWSTGRREHYRRQALTALHSLAAYHLTKGIYAGAENLARQQIGIDNLRESAYAQLFQALALSGQRAAALSEYEALRKLLREELNAEPSRAIRELIAQIRSGQLDLPSSDTDGLALTLPSNTAPAAPTARPPVIPPPDKSLDNPPCPYRGLFAFREEDAPFFFGREDFTDQLLAAVQHQPLVAVVGPSGVGKSSVVHAGLIPHLRRDGRWLITAFRPGDRPFQTLAGGLVDLLSPDLGETERLVEVRQLASALLDGRVTLLDVVERVLDKHKNGQKPRLLLVADQFEELYALLSDAGQRQRFLDVLFESIYEQQDRDNPTFTLVLTLRADFMGQALAYRPVADALRDADVKLGPMTRPELTRAVVNPTHLQQVSFEPGLVARILQDVGHEPGNLPLLEFAMASLWDLQEHRHLNHQAYEAIGRVEGALGHYADAMLGTLAPAEQEMARRIFTQLVQPGDGTEDTRRVATRSEIGEDAWCVVQKLANSRLLVTGQNSFGQETAEVIHEALIRCWDLLRTWMAEDRAFRVWQERLRVAMRNWESQGHDDGALMRGVTLAVAEQWLAQRPANVGQAEALFIEESATQNVRRTSERENIKATLALRERELAASQAQGRRLRLIAFLLAAALIVTVVAYLLTTL